MYYLLTLSQKTDETATDDAENLHVVIEYSLKYSETTKLYVFFSKDEATNLHEDIANNNNFKSFKYKATLSQNTVA